MKQCSKQGIILVIAICLFFSWKTLFAGTVTPQEKYQFTEKFKVGVDEAIETKDQPYQFSYISSIDCDKNGNIYVLDSQESHVRKFTPHGEFIVQFFQRGQGPSDLVNPCNICINQYSDHMFILQDYGLSMKEFMLNGGYVKYNVLPKQFFGDFYFMNKDEFLFVNTVPKKEKFNNFMRLNVSQKKIVQEFAPTEMSYVFNQIQRFAITSNSILWTARGNEMKLFAYDLKTGKKVQEIQIPGNFKKNTTSEAAGMGDSQVTYVIYYNVAQPFIINDQLLILIVIQDFQKKNGRIDRFPIKTERIIYQVNGSNFQKLGVVNDSEDAYLGTVHKNRLILFSNEPYGHFRVFEFNKIGSNGK